MKRFGTAIVLSLALTTGSAIATAQTMPVNQFGAGASSTMPLELAQFYIFGGRHYCFYLDGWHGPGWYWCGYAWHRGFGWGGPRGWRGWRSGPHFRPGRPGPHFRPGGPGPRPGPGPGGHGPGPGGHGPGPGGHGPGHGSHHH
jgi:hypothetical protein